ncbi:phosphatidylserine decarboxylase [Binucleata daphniae]
MKAKKGAKIDMFKKEIQKLNAFASDLRIEIDNLRMEIGKSNNKKNDKNDTKTDKDCKCKYENSSSKINHFNIDFLYKKDDDETNDMTHKNRKVNEDIENKKPFYVKTLDDNKESKIENNKNNNKFVVKKTKHDNKSTIIDDEIGETCANSSSLVTEKNDVKNLSTPISIYIVSVKLKNDDKSVYLINFSIQQDSVKKHIHATKKFPIFVKRDIKEELVVTIYKKGTIYNTFVKKFGTIDFVGTFVIDNIKIKVTKDETVYFPDYFKTRIISRNNYLKALLSVELNNLSFFQRMLQYLNFMNTRWLLPDAKVYVKDLRTGEIIEEKTSRMVKYYLTFFYTKRLAESRFYRHLIKKMTIKIGMKMNNPKSTNLIKSFVDYFKINMNEVKKPMCDFTSFNDFFCRELNSDARKIENSKLVSSPADWGSRITASKRRLLGNVGLTAKGDLPSQRICLNRLMYTRGIQSLVFSFVRMNIFTCFITM